MKKFDCTPLTDDEEAEWRGTPGIAPHLMKLFAKIDREREQRTSHDECAKILDEAAAKIERIAKMTDDSSLLALAKIRADTYRDGAALLRQVACDSGNCISVGDVVEVVRRRLPYSKVFIDTLEGTRFTVDRVESDGRIAAEGWKGAISLVHVVKIGGER